MTKKQIELEILEKNGIVTFETVNGQEIKVNPVDVGVKDPTFEAIHENGETAVGNLKEIAAKLEEWKVSK